jgi:protein-export membrane protein SecD
MSKNKLNIILIIFIFLLGGIFVYPNLPNVPNLPDFKVFGKNLGKMIREQEFKLGLDLKGGAHLVYKADMSQVPVENVEESFAGIRDVIEKRVNYFGTTEPEVVTRKADNNYQIIIDLPGIENVNEAIEMIGQTPTLDFREKKTQDDYRLSEEEKEAAKQENEEAKQKAEEILEKAKNAEDFSELAKEYSEDPSVEQNAGDLGFFKKGDMVPAFSEVAFNEEFETGEVWGELVKSQFGYHIIKKTDERGEGEEKEVKASHILFRTVDEEFKPEYQYRDLPQAAMITYKRTELTGKNLERATVAYDQISNQPKVLLEFDEEGKQLFKEITERNVGKQVAIFLDGQPVTEPVVQTVISDGKAEISMGGEGAFVEKKEEAQEIAKQLNAGALPVPIELVSQEKIGPSLGEISLQKSLIAGLFGLGILGGVMIILYLFLGIIVVISLLFYGVLLTAIFKILGITLTLSGIAGFILSIGMAVDANILIFERIKEEIRKSKAINRESIENGFKKAWPSIRDGNLSTIITCFILYAFGTGVVKGFAVALGFGVALSMFSAVFVTRNIIEFLYSIFKAKLFFGLHKQSKNKTD